VDCAQQLPEEAEDLQLHATPRHPGRQSCVTSRLLLLHRWHIGPWRRRAGSEPHLSM
jgi:hypothetical protein